MSAEAGIYFEEIGRIQLYHEEWKLVTYINMSNFEDEYKHLETMVRVVEEACNQFQNTKLDPSNSIVFDTRAGCGPVLAEIKIIMREIDEYNSRWFYVRKEVEALSRKKRGLLNFIGEVSKSLFGTLSQSDSEEYLAEFANLRKRGAQTDSIVKRHTTLIESSINMLRTTHEQMENQGREVDRLIKEIREDINTIKIHDMWWRRTVAAKDKVQDLVSYVTLLIISFQAKQQQFLHTISVGEKNANNPILIPPQLFTEELKKIKVAAGALKADLPMEITRDTITMFYQMSTPRVRILNNQLIICFTIPLVSMEEFTLYKVTSYPNRIVDSYFNYIVPTFEYIALDKFKLHHVYLNNEEINNCHSVKGDRLVCKHTSPIMTSHNTKICEVKLLQNEPLSDECDVRIGNLTREVWIKLRQPNSWIYTFPEEETVHVGCDSQISDKKVKGSGILTISAGCEINTNNILIKGFWTAETHIYKSFIPSFKTNSNLIETVTEFKKIEKFDLKPIVHPNIVNFGQKEKLVEMSLSLNEIKRMENELQNFYTPADVKNRIGWIAIIISLLITLVILVYCRYGYKKIGKTSRKLQEGREPELIKGPTIIPKRRSERNLQESYGGSKVKITLAETHEEEGDLLEMM
jgi:flagellar basal body-associated protein FliL